MIVLKTIQDNSFLTELAKIERTLLENIQLDYDINCDPYHNIGLLKLLIKIRQCYIKTHKQG